MGTPPARREPWSRREFLQVGGAAAAVGLVAPRALRGTPARRRPAGSAGTPGATRRPGSLPDPRRPAGTATEHLPFDHVVIVMQENHSFDNDFGMLPVRGQPLADGFTFDDRQRPLNVNPAPGGYLRAYRNDGPCQTNGVTQAWTATHRQIDGGKMDGFVATSGPGAMSYRDEEDLPFYYSFAKAFTLANRWFCSAPCQTYPNRRYLMAGTSNGLISTDVGNINTPAGPNGTIWDHLSAAGLSWRNYFTDLPSSAIISSTVTSHLGNYAPLAQFHLDCLTGNLPAVSLVDPDFNAMDTALGLAQGLPGVADVAGQLPASVNTWLDVLRAQGASEENPTNVNFGESFVAAVVRSVLASPQWPRTLLVWTYDEHGGYYDHVPPPAAIPPDDVAPLLQPGDAPGAFDRYGPRVPAVVMSPYARRGGVTNVVHDHTSVLATIEAKWNLPALTWRDANAATLADFLDLRSPPNLEPPKLEAPGDALGNDTNCKTSADPRVVSSPSAPFPPNDPGGPAAPAPTTPASPLTRLSTELLGELGF